MIGDDYCNGYHLKDLFVGSQYSLGIPFEIVLKLVPITPFLYKTTFSCGSNSTNSVSRLLLVVRLLRELNDRGQCKFVDGL